MELSSVFVCAGKKMNDFDCHVSSPLMRKSFIVDNIPKKAELSVCGLGFYRIFINGREITKGLLAPYISNSDDICAYDIYDVTEKLRKGENVIGIILGNGMQNQPGGVIWDFQLAPFRSSPKLAFYMETDGKPFIDSASDFLWHPSAITFDDLRSGERYDSRLEINGWNEPGFDESEWKKVEPAPTPKGEKVVCTADPIVCTEILSPLRMIKAGFVQPPKPNQFGECPAPDDEKLCEGYLFDFGVNAAGIFHMEIDGDAGQKIMLQFGEVFEDGKLDVRQMYFLPPWYDHRCVFICRGGKQVYEPSFTYFGYRYCLVSGITEKQANEIKLTYKVAHSDIKRKTSFRCSDGIANELFDAAIVSDLANFWYFPTDCPHREKNGWTGDASLSAEQMMTNFACEKSLEFWLANIRKAQKPSGELPGIIPTGGWGFAWGNGPAWDSVCVNVPYAIYRHTGDKSVLKENADMIYRYIKYMKTKADENGLYAYGLGDWCPVGGKILTPLVLTDSVTLYSLLKKAEFIFKVLNQDERAADALTEAEKIKISVRKNLINNLSAGTQTGQAMCLYYGIFNKDEEDEAFEILLKLIHEKNDHFDCGILGARCLFRLLADRNEAQLAWKLITQLEEPSFGHWISHGATSLYENFGYPQSRNHHFYGDISAFFLKYAVGIDVNPNDNDCENVNICPDFSLPLSFAEGISHGVHVKIVSVKDKTELEIEVPEHIHGKIIPKNAVFFDGEKEKILQSGKYEMKRM